MNTHLTAVERQAESATAEGAGEALLHQENRHRCGSDLIQGLEDAVHDDGGESEGGVVGAGIAGRGSLLSSVVVRRPCSGTSWGEGHLRQLRSEGESMDDDWVVANALEVIDKVRARGLALGGRWIRRSSRVDLLGAQRCRRHYSADFGDSLRLIRAQDTDGQAAFRGSRPRR